jgi:putative transposase
VRTKDAENAEVVNWRLLLAENHSSWGFALCYLHLRNVRGFKRNHMRVYPLNKELRLNMRI